MLERPKYFINRANILKNIGRNIELDSRLGVRTIVPQITMIDLSIIEVIIATHFQSRSSKVMEDFLRSDVKHRIPQKVLEEKINKWLPVNSNFQSQSLDSLILQIIWQESKNCMKHISSAHEKLDTCTHWCTGWRNLL